MSDILSAVHLRVLREESGISDTVIEARGYRAVTDRKKLSALGFSKRQLQPPDLLIPLHATDGSIPLYVFRPDKPREENGKVIKYEIPRGSGVRLDCPPVCCPLLPDPAIPLWITEGIKKADSLASRGACAVALLGVWNFKGKNPFGGTTFLADWDYIALDGRDVRIVFDSDLLLKPEVRKALERLTEHLQRKGAHVSAVYLPLENGKKCGVDDYLAQGHTISDLEALIEGPRPQPHAAPARTELLEDVPLAIRRPLALVGDRAYAAIWPHVRTTRTEDLDKQGNVIKLNPPSVKTQQRLFIVRDDGRLFGDGGDEPLENLGMEMHLPEIPQAEKLWSVPSVKAYAAGSRPDPAAVFQQIAEVVDRFIDFDRSLADQKTMCEFVACYILTTYFLDAFTVVGFLWPNGERGSGKTQLLLVVTEMAYLGQTILAGGSYASLRDLADYGATLAFDDAENLSDPRKSDPDKRTLLLAGNRKGSTVSVKEPAPDRTWQTRHVNTFCPRLFSAIRLPDEVLASRSIIVPLIRTIDRAKANADPLDYKLWPHDRRKLVDKCWMLGLSHLPDLCRYEMLVNDHADLSGRTLEPWRALLAVALWLDDSGAKGLFERMSALSIDYQKERPDFESGDLTGLVIRALCDCAISAMKAISAVKNGDSREGIFTIKDVVGAAKHIAVDSELDIDPERVTARRVGRVLAKMRLTQEPRSGGRGSRTWRVSASDLKRWSELYGVPLSDTQYINSTNGGNGSNGTDSNTNADPEQPDDLSFEGYKS